MQQDAAFFGEDAELALVYIAKKLKEAIKLEELLTASEVDYLVEPDKYRGGFIFQTERVGAFFYVHPDKEAEVRELLRSKGYRPFEAS